MRFRTLKTELVYLGAYKTCPDAKQSIFDYLEVLDNRQRRHSSLGCLAPAEFENINNAKVAKLRIHKIGKHQTP